MPHTVPPVRHVDTAAREEANAQERVKIIYSSKVHYCARSKPRLHETACNVCARVRTVSTCTCATKNRSCGTAVV